MSIRKISLGIAAAVVSAFLACAPPPPELCKRSVALTCDRVHECTPQASKDTDLWKGMFGADPAACKTAMETSSKCASKTTENELCPATDGGTNGTYNLGKAAECSDQTKALSCEDFMNAAKRPAACAEVCKF